MLTRDVACRLIEEHLAMRQVSIAEEIARTQLYFRVSVIGGCNLSCPFCHNEGGPTRGVIDTAVLESALRAAADVGFSRVQFTGGEPTLHPRLHEVIRQGRRIFDDVGVTTNGTRLTECFAKLLMAGMTRLHISVQRESMTEGGAIDWEVPRWLDSATQSAATANVRIQINLPVAAADTNHAEAFLTRESTFAYDWKIFALLPMVRRVETVRHRAGASGSVFIRGYQEPRGIRCSSCAAKEACREQSRSLRLGVNHVLRLCLATRAWDMPFDIASPVASLREATL